MHKFLKNTPAKPDLTWKSWNDGALGFFEDGRPNKKINNKKMSNDESSSRSNNTEFIAV